MYDKVITVGSRKSELALIQTKYVIRQLELLYPEKKFKIHTMTTVGDRVLNISLPKIGEKSLFTKDLEDALKTGVVDLVVHSLKDLPTSLPNEMAIGAILKREDPSDALVLGEKFRGKALDSLPDGSIIGTSSLRRSAQLSAQYPHLKVCDVRGNLNTRLAKLDATDSPMAGLLLAKAGLVRMGWQHRVDQTLDSETALYAVGQGALAVECRSNDSYITNLLAPLSHKETVLCALAERSFLKRLGGGCSAPVAVSTKLYSLDEDSNNFKLEIRGAVWSLDGKTKIDDSLSTSVQEFETKTDIDEDSGSVAKRVKLNEPDIETTIIENANENDNNTVLELSNNTNDCKNESLPQSEVIKEISGQDMNHDHSFVLPVGQDFMGQCPFLEAGHIKNIDKCPYKISEKDKDVICPLRYTHQKNDMSNTIASTSLNLEKCPFLKINKINCEEENIVDTKANHTNNDIDKNIVLYCGILGQNNITEAIMEKCENLGTQLGDILIKNGALEIIKCAQKQISLSS